LDVYATRLNATALQNNINFSMGVDDKSQKLQYFLSGNVAQQKNGGMAIHLNSDSLLLNYDRWQINPANNITVGTGISARDFILSQAGQQLSVQSLGAGADAPLEVKLTAFQLSTLTSFLQADSALVDGVANGTVTFTNLTQQPLFTGNLTVTDLAVQRDTIGTLAAQVSSNGSTYTTNTTITGRGNDIALTGTVTPGQNDMRMDLDLAIRKFALSTLKGAMKDFITDASGNLYGNVRVNGSTSDPNIDGKINFDNAVITTVVIGGPFRINNESLVVVNNEGFIVDKFSIRDSANNALTFDGRAGTTNFTNYNLDLNIRGRNFMAVNNTKKDNELFYGKLNISTTLHIGGTEAAPVVDGNLSINEGTNFAVVIPQQDPGVVSREGVVEFVDFDAAKNDSLLMVPYDSLNRSSLVGFEVATNITVSKDAIFNVVIDEANGDFVNLQGEATLSAGIDPSGKINLTGNYVIEQGSYQLSYNFIQRKFDIEKGSRIEWFGEPTSAEVDLTAIHVANTAPLDLVSDYIPESNTNLRKTYLQKLPFQVLLNMEGELLKPTITFDVRLPTDKNYNVSSEIISNVDIRLAQLRQEPSEMNKQVFSLLLLGRFVGENPFESSGDGFSAKSYAMQSVSKLMTEQLNNLAGNLIAGVDLNFDVTSSDDYTTGTRRNRTDLNVGLSKQLLSNRLTVSVGSNFAVAGQQNANQQGSNLAGNVALSYQLSRDGRYMLRAYRRNEYFGVVDGYIVETGLRFIITLDYDRFMDLFRRKKARQENRNTQNSTNE
ncbi:MAG: translocation/assembly module TamB, partial [Bacteroidota bacterium]|nr:translocation/assembly module TamB [Bacteroidota bacterium]